MDNMIPSVEVPDPPQDKPDVIPPGHIWCSPMKRLYTRKEYERLRANLAIYNRRQPVTMTELRVAEFGGQYGWTLYDGGTPSRAWRSSGFIAMLFNNPATKASRLSVCRTQLDDDGQFRADITWDELMWVKLECGYGEAWAVELFPPPDRVVNVTNMRHLWFLKEPPSFAW